MIFKIKNTLLPHSWFEKVITDTLDLYTQGKDISNSPLVQFQRNYKTTGGMHLDCYKEKDGDYEAAIQKRQQKVIDLFEDIRLHGYKDTTVICVSFDSEGYVYLYDGHHRLSILRYLGIEAEVTCTTEWKGAVDGSGGKDFPLIETIEHSHKGKRYLYQWIPDSRVQDLPCSRPKDHQEARLKWLLGNLKGKTVLDIGCSEGYFSNELAKRGYKVIGVDIDRDLISIARYTANIQGLDTKFITGDWREVIRDYQHFDNILYFAVLHNQINANGDVKSFEDLELFRGRAEQLYCEVPDIEKQPDWAYIFSPDRFEPALEFRTKLNIQEKFVHYRPIYRLTPEEKPSFQLAEEKLDIPVTVNGYKMHLLHHDYVTNIIKRDNTWEPRTTQFIKDHLKPGQTFVDVGSQAGYYALLAASLGAKVDAFEPCSSTFKVLTENVWHLNDYGDTVNLHNVALSDKNGMEKLFIRDTPGQNSMIRTGTHFEMVETIRFDENFDVPDWLKIDVEGFESHVLDGMNNVLNATKPIYIIIEDWDTKIPNWLIEKAGFKRVTTERGYGNHILAKNIDVTYEREPMRIHLLGPFNTPTSLKDEGVGNAFGTKTVKMAKILKKLGHYVIFYGVEGSEVECDEFVQVSTRDILEKTYGKWVPDKVYGCAYGDLAHKTFIANAIREINARKFPNDFLFCSHGNFHKEIAVGTKIPNTVEIGIGYTGSFAKYRIFESYYMMNYTYGMEKRGDIDFYNTVIPGYFELNDFEYRDSFNKEDYYLYLGRCVKRKGIGIAQQLADKLGLKLKVAGFASRDNKFDIEAFEEVLKSPNVEYVGFAGLEKRKELMSKAKAVFMPTTYLEPFGYVAIEAMLSGTPVITTDGGAFNETVLHGVTGYRCRNFEEFVWATKNIDKIKSEDCRQWAVKNYGMEAATQKYKEYFDHILSLYENGWYTENPTRTDLDYLKIRL